jgi:hypothetical protein
MDGCETRSRSASGPEHLRRTLTIALVVGTILTAINQGDVIVRGEASFATLAKGALRGPPAVGPLERVGWANPR